MKRDGGRASNRGGEHTGVSFVVTLLQVTTTVTTAVCYHCIATNGKEVVVVVVVVHEVKAWWLYLPRRCSPYQ